MARLAFEENYGIFWVPEVSDLSSPTTTEIDAGTDITAYVTKDGVNPGSTNNRINTGSIASALDSEELGSYGYSLSLTCFKDDEDDTAWDLFERGARGHVVVSPYKQDPSSGDAVYVWKVAAGEPTLPASAANSQQTFTVEFAVQDADVHAAVGGA